MIKVTILDEETGKTYGDIFDGDELRKSAVARMQFNIRILRLSNSFLNALKEELKEEQKQ